MIKLHGDISINGQKYRKGAEVSWLQVYPFFLLHMLMFGWAGFYMAYSGKGPSVPILYAHGGFAIVCYLVFYVTIFGRDEVKWMFINAGLGLFGICSQIEWLLSLFGRKFDDYPLSVHVIPFLYFVLYTFLIRQAVLDLTKAREDEARRKQVDTAFVVGSVIVYVALFFLWKRI